MNWSTETWEAMARKLGWHIGHLLAVVLFNVTRPFPSLREKLRRWAWS